MVAEVGAGGSFGELALMYGAPRAASVQAVEDSKVWALGRSDFTMLLMHGRQALSIEELPWKDDATIKAQS